LLSAANSAALRVSGIDRSTVSPSPLVTIDRDPVSGEPTGVFVEETTEPIVEFTVMAAAPNFTEDQRTEALVRGMKEYNSVGTTSIFEGHGISPDVLAAYQRVRNAGQQTLRAYLVFSPSWSGTNEADIPLMLASWARWLARRGMGDHWLRMADLYTEVNVSPEARLRKRTPVQTGWAGYNPDSGLSRNGVLELMKEAARNDIRISGIWPDLIDLFKEVDKEIPLAGRRWVLSHQRVLSDEQVKLIRDMGVVISTHTNRHIYKQGAAIRWRIGAEKENTIVPIRTLLDNKVPVAFGTDGLPPSLFGPIRHAVERIDRETGDVIAPAQRISRLEALRCATAGGAYLTFEEKAKGSIEPGKLADVVALTADPLNVEAGQLAGIGADLTIVGGRIVHDRSEPTSGTRL
jgi:predicted amidohydrolase YtcJ